MKTLIAVFASCLSLVCLGQNAAWYNSIVANANASGVSTGGGSSGPVVGFVKNLNGQASSFGSSVNLAVPTGGVGQGSNVVVVCWKAETDAGGGCSVADTRLNTYSTLTTYRTTNSATIFLFQILSAPMATALQAGDNITVTYSAGSPWFFDALVMTNVSGIDVTATNFISFDTAVTCPQTTTTANTFTLGVVMNHNSTSRTYGSGNWTTITNISVASSVDVYLVGHTETTTGSKDPGGAWNTATEIWAAWAAIK